MADKRKRGLTRREFMAGAAAAAGSLALPGCSPGDGAQAGAAAGVKKLPLPADSGIDHIVVVMMENRSFDHFLGWVPGADGVQAGVRLKDRDGVEHESYDLAPDFQNCDLSDPDHTYAGGRTEINGGKMDGFLLTQPVGDRFPIGYYTADSLPFFKGCAEHWTICDRYFSGILALTTPNRMYMHAGQTDRVANGVDISTLPTVWDRMIEQGRKVAYYYTDVSYTSFWGDKYKGFSKKYDFTGFAADLAGADLPDLMFVDNVGNTLNEGGAISRDDHPYSDVRNGQAFLNQVYDTLRQHPQWERTLLVINYDEWGGFYDHVPPPLAPVTPEEAALGNDGRLGCRVPCVLIGPRVRRGHVEHLQFDPNSILNMIAWRFGFEPLGARASSNNLALALDFGRAPDVSAPAFDVPAGPFGGVCIPIQFLASNSSPLPLPAPSWPLPPVPLPVPVQMPSIPGFDVPVTEPDFPTLLGKALQESARRRTEHEAELEALRQLGAAFGF
ncbi:MAG TPA: alkaline phosphatase family protein [Candidatus Binatia bacterium]|nr:alkaline phosphatase family protein [Candidatus Binatia bacterium]